MPVNDELGKRMKKFYESVSKTRLMRRTPVAIRIDGKAFHTFTKGMKKPFDDILIKTMQQTMKYLCKNIQGCVLGYAQSDEITLILVDYQNINSGAWFDYKIQKLCSVAASMATMAFNRFFATNVDEFYYSIWDESLEDGEASNEQIEYSKVLFKAVDRAMFDARCFNIPKEEVANLIYWRQLDATRNSIQMVGQAYFSEKELHGKSCSKIQEMLMEKYNIDWNNLPTHKKFGSCCIKKQVQDERFDIKDGAYPVLKWVIDEDISIFKDEGRKYIEDLIYIGE